MDKNTWLRNGISNNLIDRRGVVPPRESTIEEWLGETMQRGVGNIYQLSGLAAALNPRIDLKGGPGTWTGEYLPPLSNDWVLKRDENRLFPRVDNGYPSPGYILGPDGKIMAVKDTRNVEDKFGRDAAGVGAAAPDKRGRARQPAQVDTAFRFSSPQSKSSGQMAEWWQSPAYNARAAAGQVQTPGLIDIGGITQRLYDDFQAPYWRRQDQMQGAAVADPMQLRYTAQPRFVAQSGAQDPISVYAKSNYTAQPRFASASSAPALPNQPSGSVRVAKDSSRLPGDPNPYNGLAFGYDAQPSAPVNPAVRAIEAAAPTGPMFPLRMPAATGTPYKGNYTASMRFASPNAGKTGDGIIDLTASNPSERGAQGIADSQGAPVRVGQKVYYPGGKAPQGAPARGITSAPAKTQPGLFGGLFGGGPVPTGGLFGVPRPGPNISAPGGGGAFISSASSQPASSPLSGVGGENSLLPAALNSERWRSGY